MSTIATFPTGRSWSGTIDYGPGALYAPTSIDALQALVARTPRIRALGTRHSFSTVAASDADLVSLRAMPADIDIDPAAGTVRVAGGVRYGELALAAWDAGLALPNMGSLPHISVAGASSTGTHGSGSTNVALAPGVRAISLVTADGDLVELSREADPDVFKGTVLSLGSLGVITHLELDMLPAFEVRQAVYLDLPAERLNSDDLTALMNSAFSVSLFHDLDGHIAQVWVKQKVEADGGGADGIDSLPTDATSPFPDVFYGARRAAGPMHPLAGVPADFCTDQSGMPGPSFTRLPHFRLEFTPSSGEEIQSEYYVAIEDLAAALAALQEIAGLIRRVLMVSEVRTVAADDLWLSAAHHRPSACLHFTWKREPEAVHAVLPEVEAALAPFSPRPHWGKVFTLAPDVVRSHYPRLADFRALRARMDPKGKFANEYVDSMIGR
jgi:xylitol oxidase